VIKFSKWTVVGQSGWVAIVNEEYTGSDYEYPAKAGAQWLDLTGGLDANAQTGVQQSVQTISGQAYELTFSVGNTYGRGGSSTVNVVICGVTRMVAINFANADPSLTWKTFSLEFVAAGEKTAIAFINGDPAGDAINGLDAVSLTALAR
jgi:hypothetical protein